MKELSILNKTVQTKLSCLFGFEGTGNKTNVVWVNGVKKCSFVVQPRKVYNFEALIPRNLYETAHKINIAIKSPNGSGVYLAGLKVYRMTSDKGSGGPQSFADANVESQNQLIITPNPFSDETMIGLHYSGAMNSRASLKIYDATGCLIKRFDHLSDRLSTQVAWDGCDDSGKRLPNGIYFVKLNTATTAITQKIVILR